MSNFVKTSLFALALAFVAAPLAMAAPEDGMKTFGKALGAGLFIACAAVDLSGQEKSGQILGFKG